MSVKEVPANQQPEAIEAACFIDGIGQAIEMTLIYSSDEPPLQITRIKIVVAGKTIFEASK